MKLCKLLLLMVMAAAASGMATKEKCGNSCCEKKCEYEYLWKPDGHKGMESIFNGKDLTGWRQPESKCWKVEDGSIAFCGAMDNKHRESGYIWSEKQYGDFILELEFKISKGANSGVFFRTANIAEPVQNGLEIQIEDSFGKKDGMLEKYDCGSLYDCHSPFHNMAKKAGQWNKLVLVCKGPRVYVAMNGTGIVSAHLGLWHKKAGLNPDGTKNKYEKTVASMPRYGHIGFQDHGCKVWFRNIRIRDLKK